MKKYGLRRILLDKFCMRRIVFHKKSGLRRIFFIKSLFFIIRGCMSFEDFSSVYQFISGENDSNSNTK